MDTGSFWKRVKQLILAHNMTQVQFADHIGISRNTFRGWIHYDRIPELTAAYSIAFTLGVSLEYLLSGKDKDITDLRLEVIEARKAVTRAYKLIDELQKQLKILRPLTESRVRKEKRG